MTPEQFVYWMQGFAELNSEPPTPEQWQSIRDHLALVFNKQTPPVKIDWPAVPYSPPPATPWTYPQTICAVVSDERATLTC